MANEEIFKAISFDFIRALWISSDTHVYATDPRLPEDFPINFIGMKVLL